MVDAEPQWAESLPMRHDEPSPRVLRYWACFSAEGDKSQ